MGRTANPARNNGLRPQVSAVRPTSRAIGTIASWAATMQADIIAVASSGQHDAQTEDDQRAGLEQDAVAGGTGGSPSRVWFLIQVSRPIVVDGGGWDREHRKGCEHSEDRYE